MPDALPTPPPSLPPAHVSPPAAPTAKGLVNPNAGLAISAKDKAGTAEHLAKEVRLSEYAKRIRNAVASIDMVSHTGTRAILGGYYRLINPKLTRFGQQEFPKTVRHHARSDERSTEYSKPALLFFHIGNAILGLYDYALTRSSECRTGDPTTRVLESRIALLEDIALQGLGKFAMVGDENLGFALERGS